MHEPEGARNNPKRCTAVDGEEYAYSLDSVLSLWLCDSTIKPVGGFGMKQIILAVALAIVATAAQAQGTNPNSYPVQGYTTREQRHLRGSAPADQSERHPARQLWRHRQRQIRTQASSAPVIHETNLAARWRSFSRSSGGCTAIGFGNNFAARVNLALVHAAAPGAQSPRLVMSP